MENNNDIMTEDFLGFDDADFASEDLDGGNQTEEQEPAAEESDVSTESGQAEEPESGGENAPEETHPETNEDPDAGLPEKITIKHLRGDVDIPKADIRTMLSKGYDYDRVREQRDAAVRQMEEKESQYQQRDELLQTLENVAKQAGTDVAGVVKRLRINLYRGNGSTEAEAMARVEKEDAEAKLQAMQKQANQARQAQEQRQSRAQQEFMEFHQRFPDVKIQDIPQDVIRKSASGEMSLAGAYQVHLYDQLKAENQRLQQTIDARKQNEENLKKTTGSARSSGSKTQMDDFLKGFNFE